MVVIDVLDNTGNKVSQAKLKDAIFDIPVNKSVLHQVVVAQLSNRRAGTVGVKGRSDVVGSGRKLYRQKGTGRARKGDIKSPILRGGGVIFGPVARSYKKKVMKKVSKLALKMALTVKLREKQLILINNFGLTTIKTKAFVEIIDNIGANNSLIITNHSDNYLKLSSRNVQKIKILKYENMNVLDILNHSKLVIVESSLKGIDRKLL